MLYRRIFPVKYVYKNISHFFQHWIRRYVPSEKLKFLHSGQVTFNRLIITIPERGWAQLNYYFQMKYSREAGLRYHFLNLCTIFFPLHLIHCVVWHVPTMKWNYILFMIETHPIFWSKISIVSKFLKWYINSRKAIRRLSP